MGSYAGEGWSHRGAAFLGMFVGAPFAGWLSDRFGRRRLFIGLLFFFSLIMILAAVAPTPGVSAFFRFVAGVGFGGIPPTAIAQPYEFASPDRKVVFTAVMLSGFGIGAILAAGLSIHLRRGPIRGGGRSAAGGLLLKAGAHLSGNVLVFAALSVLAGLCILSIPRTLREVQSAHRVMLSELPTTESTLLS